MSFESLIHAPDNIVASLLYLLICFITIAWLLVIYFNKKRKKTMQGFFFKLIIYTIICLLLSDAVILLMLFHGTEEWIYRIVFTFHWECFIMWFGTYRVYNILFLSGIGDKEWSKKNNFK